MPTSQELLDQILKRNQQVAQAQAQQPPAQRPQFTDAQIKPVQDLLAMAGREASRENAIKMLEAQRHVYESASPWETGVHKRDPIWQLGANLTGIGGAAPEPGEAGWEPGTPLSEAQQYRYGLKSYAQQEAGTVKMSPETKLETQKQQFREAINAGDIPKGSKFLAPSMDRAARELADREGMSLDAARKTIQRYRKNPGAPEFSMVKETLEELTGWGYMPPKVKKEISPLVLARNVRFERDNIIIKDQYMSVEDWNKIFKDMPREMAAKYQRIAMEDGFPAMESAMQADYENYQRERGKALQEWATGQRVDKANRQRAEALQAYAAAKVRAKELQEYAESIKASREPTGRDTVQGRLNIIRERYNRNKTMAEEVWRGTTPWDESKGEKVTIKGGAIMAAELLVPGVYLGRHWKDLSAGEKALFIALDVAVLYPVLGAAGRGAKTVGTASRAARFAAAARGVGSEAAAIARAPVDIILHPLEAGKSVGRQVKVLATNIGHPGKLPEAIATTSSGTVRLEIGKGLTERQAIAVRDKLMELAAKGERPVVEMGGYRIELTRSPLMRELKGGLAHATPSGELMEGGFIVRAKPGMPASEQGLFWSHEPATKFTGTSAFGMKGKKPTIIIADPATAKPKPTGKIFRMTAEMEVKSEVAVELPPAKQTLITHIGPEAYRTEIRLINKTLTPRQIAKLKAESLIEQIKAPFQPAIKIKRIKGTPKGLTDPEVENFIKILNEADARAEARALSRVGRVALAGRRVAPTLTRVIKVSRKLSPSQTREIMEGLRAPARADARIIGPSRVRYLQRPPESLTLALRISRGERLPPERVRPGTRVNTLSRTPPRGGDFDRGEPSRVEPGEVRAARRGETSRSRAPGRAARSTRTPPGEPGRPPISGQSGKALRVPPPETPPPGEPGKPKKPGKGPAKKETGKRHDFQYAITWRQGLFWWVLWPDGFTRALKEKPEGAKVVPPPTKKTPKATIQMLSGSPPKKPLSLDMGIMDVTLNQPPKVPNTKKDAIGFSLDQQQKTTAEIILGRPRSSRSGSIKPIMPRKLRSKKKGRLFYTRAGKETLISRRKLGGLV